MKQITREICEAFERGRVLKVGNTFSDGTRLFLHDNLIAEHKPDGLYITNAGWQTNVTKEKLNGLTGVSIIQRKGKWHLNGSEWNGEWIRVNTNQPPAVDKEAFGSAWNYAKKWVNSGGYRGYEEPLYAVCGANDTGMWDDSPCRSDVAERELKEAKAKLKKSGIPTKLVTCETSNVFCVHHYLIVRPKDIDKAMSVMSELIRETHLRLLYKCDPS